MNKVNFLEKSIMFFFFFFPINLNSQCLVLVYSKNDFIKKIGSKSNCAPGLNRGLS